MKSEHLSGEVVSLLLKAKRWERITGLSGDCFRAVAIWKLLKHKFPELDGIE